MTDIALLIGDIVIYWYYFIVFLGILAGFIFAFALRPFARIKRTAILVWFVLAFCLSVFISRMLYYYCKPDQYHSIRDAMSGFLNDHYCMAGVMIGAILAALFVRLVRLVKKTGNLLDITFPGVVLTIAAIRLSYLFTDTFHSTIAVTNKFWQKLPFAVQVTDAAGNTSYVFAPFLISFLFLLLTVLILTLFVRKKLRHPGDLFRLTLTFYLLSEMVLESTRYDSLKLHFIYLYSLNKYVSFISFSMLVCGIALIILFLVNYIRSVKTAGARKSILPLIMFVIGFIGFGIFEYLVQRYTSNEVLFHLIQTGFALLMAINVIAVIMQKNARRR